MFTTERGFEGVYVDSAANLQVNMCHVEGSFTHQCPKYFDSSAHCDRHKCNVTYLYTWAFDMFEYEEEMYFMK